MNEIKFFRKNDKRNRKEKEQFLKQSYHHAKFRKGDCQMKVVQKDMRRNYARHSVMNVHRYAHP